MVTVSVCVECVCHVRGGPVGNGSADVHGRNDGRPAGNGHRGTGGHTHTSHHHTPPIVTYLTPSHPSHCHIPPTLTSLPLSHPSHHHTPPIVTSLPPSQAEDPDDEDLMQNPEFLHSVLSSLPGVNPEEALHNLEQMTDQDQDEVRRVVAKWVWLYILLDHICKHWECPSALLDLCVNMLNKLVFGLICNYPTTTSSS